MYYTIASSSILVNFYPLGR